MFVKGEIMMKKTALLAAFCCFMFNFSLNAYRYRVANLNNHPISIDLRGAAKGSLFIGDSGAKDSWRIKGYDTIPAKSTKDYSFGGLFGPGTAAYCIEAIRVGKSSNNMAPIQIQKAPEDTAAFNDTVSKISIIGNTLEQGAGKVPGTVGVALQSVAASLNQVINPIAGLAQDWLCFDMTFYIGPNPHKKTNLYDYVAIAQQGIQNTNKFTGIKANLNEPSTLPKTNFWQRVKDDILPAATKKAKQAASAAGGASKLKDAAKDAAKSAYSRF